MSVESREGAAVALLDFIDASPSPWHAGEEMTARCAQAGAELLNEDDRWQLRPGGFYVVRRGQSSVIAFRLGHAAGPLRAIGAHTDSPGFRIKPEGSLMRAGVESVGVEIYGGPILATFADRDLSVAGRVVVDTDAGPAVRLFRHPAPLLRLPNLAIHMNRDVNTQGLRFDAHDQLPLLFRLPGDDEPGFREWLASQLDVTGEAVRAWELAVYDTQPGSLFGPEQEFVADSQLDNLASCHAALETLLAANPDSGVALVAAFDHEEVGSESYKGAAGNFLGECLRRIAAVAEFDAPALLSQGWMLSADMAHAWNPGFAAAYDESHAPLVNRGPAIKINARQRYATDAEGEAYFAELCRRADVPCQRYVHRASLPCGSTIGPIASTRLGLRTVDVGNPMWAMHSARESAGALDHGYLIRAFDEFFAEL
jgi:aspartyl aminopeptidase